MAGVSRGLLELVQRTVDGLGYQLVDVERLGGGLLRVTLDAAEGIGLKDCERVSTQLSHLFAVEGVDYQRLEVSSPGLDRPLKGLDDFARFVGREIDLQLYAPSAAIGGRKRVRGSLVSLIGAAGAERLQLQLTPENGAAKDGQRSVKRKRAEAAPAAVVEISFSDVGSARLVPELDFRPARAAGSSEAEVDIAAMGMSGSSSLGSEQT